MNGIIVNNDHSGRSCANQTMILSAGNGLSASNTVSYAYDSIGRLGLNPSYNHLNLAGEIGAASGDQLHYTHVYDGTKLRAVIDGDTGTVVETSDYYPFGKRIQVTAPVSEPVGGSQQASEPAVAPVAPATSVASTSSPNRWRFSGKEDQSFLGASIPLLDFGARMYNPAITRWTAADPLSEKYYGISPYVYCLGNPISIIDPNGMDIWTIKGNVVWVKESDDHRLYYVNNDDVLSDDYVSVSDRCILDDLTKTEAKVDGGAKVSSHTSKTGINDIFKVFKFASDKTKVEWAVHRNGDTYTIGTKHDSSNASSWKINDETEWVQGSFVVG